MKERPILFSAPMVRAILAGTKTQTRRVVKPQPELNADYVPSRLDRYTHHPEYHWPSRQARSMVSLSEMTACCPYGAPGDRLWVRETWQAIRCHEDGEVEEVHPIPKACGRFGIAYAATDEQADWHRDDRGFSWRPAIHMPRWASRITLEVTGVRVERLQAITDADADAEGATIDEMHGALDEVAICKAAKVLRCSYEDSRAWFGALWMEINGEDSFAANPWVWVVEFRRIEAQERAA